MAEVKAGDHRAFAQLVKRYEFALFNYLKRMTGRAADAEDLFQETFFRVHRSAHRFRDSGVFRPWVYRIATNLCMDHLRKGHRRLERVDAERKRMDTGDAEGPFDGPSAAPNPRDMAIAHETAQALETAVAELSAKHRAVFLMARYDGLSYEEIARTLRIPVGTVKSRMNKAVKTLLESLGEERR